MLYVLVGVGAAWHAPHFSQGDVAVHADRHTGAHERATLEECVLCTWKSASQATSSGSKPVGGLAAVFSAQALPSQTPVMGHFRAALARGPPSLS